MSLSGALTLQKLESEISLLRSEIAGSLSLNWASL